MSFVKQIIYEFGEESIYSLTISDIYPRRGGFKSLAYFMLFTF
jgi:hypothetical protein